MTETNVQYLNAYIDALKRQRLIYLIIGILIGLVLGCGGLLALGLILSSSMN